METPLADNLTPNNILNFKAKAEEKAKCPVRMSANHSQSQNAIFF